MSNKVYIVKIYLDKEYTQRADLGLYTADGKSTFRWSELPLSGITEAYNSEIIKAIDPITKKGSFLTGGGLVSGEGFRITVWNNNQFSLKLQELDISLCGCLTEVIELEGTDTQSSSIAIRNAYTGYIEDTDSWSVMTMTLSVKNSRHKRKVNIATMINDKKIVPVTFGSSNPSAGRYFMASRVDEVLSTPTEA